MQTSHKIHFGLAQHMDAVADASVDLVVTSPPYPMIEMWDEGMIHQNPSIGEALAANDGQRAFALMHTELDKVWAEVNRVTKAGSFVCINIGDAARSLNGEFQLYSNHSRIVTYFINNGFSCLPAILWRKPTNAPNKFMGSGMLPAGAYVTLEHEYILVFRKGGKRIFKSELEKLNRQRSAFFWEERNEWFSDTWNVRGTRQKLTDKSGRERSGAYPFEIPYRLVNMYSAKGDVVLDPFLGTGTTTLAAIAAGRNSIGYEMDERLTDVIQNCINEDCLPVLNNAIRERLDAHKVFVEKRQLSGAGDFKHYNEFYQFPVMTSQETELQLNFISGLNQSDSAIQVSYSETPLLQFGITHSQSINRAGQQVLAF